MTSRANKRPPAAPPPVEHGIPLPPGALERRLAWKAGGPPRWPWAKCGVGDSFFAVGYSTKTHGKEPVMQTRSGVAVVPGSRWLAIERVENDVRGVRVWRVA